MKKFIVEEEFKKVFPDYKLGVVVCKSIDNHIKDENTYRQILDNAQKEALKFLEEENFSSNEIIRIWREAYSRFKTKKGARSSIESLLKRVSKGNDIGTINPLVDIYNAISLKYGLPCGREDIDKFCGDIRLTKAEGNEDFITYGSDLNEPPYEGEIIYKDEKGAICRCFNYRECVRTCLSTETKNAFLIIETIDPKSKERLNAAIDELSKLIKENLNGDTEIFYLEKDNDQIVIEC